MISKTGDGLRILIKCQYLPHHDWMTLASWYSIKKNLPDASVAILCSRNNCDRPLFCWPGKLRVDFSYNASKFKDFNFPIDCDTMAVRLWDEFNKFGDAKSNEPFTFCSYKDGFGDFVMAEWINKVVPPFDKPFRVDFVNEAKITELWRKVLPLYSAIW